MNLTVIYVILIFFLFYALTVLMESEKRSVDLSSAINFCYRQLFLFFLFIYIYALFDLFTASFAH